MGINKNVKIDFRKFNTTQIIALGFAGVILIGTFILMLPISSADGNTTNFIDAMFTATTSVCVTGLVTVSTAYHWSFFGKIVILILIQLGGLGIITCASIVLVAMGKKISIAERRMIKDSYGLNDLSGMVKFVKRIVLITFTIEIIGAIFYCIELIPRFGIASGICKSIFLAVSAFCNAGMDVLGDTSLIEYANNPLITITTMALIVVGGIGFTVIIDICHVVKISREKKCSIGTIARKLSLHSKLALTISGILIFIGAIFIFIFEYNNIGTIGKENIVNKIMLSLFQSVTFRTAGFYTVLQENLTTATIMLSFVLMFIGGSPAGTAGGMKTTTIGMLLLTAISTAKNKKDTEVFKRRICSENIRMGIAVVTVGFAVAVVSIMIMCMLMPKASMVDIIFEMISALGTVGLSRGFTGTLTVAAKFLVIIVMYLGRIGPITIMIALTIKKDKNGTEITLPENKIIVG